MNSKVRFDNGAAGCNRISFYHVFRLALTNRNADKASQTSRTNDIASHSRQIVWCWASLLFIEHPGQTLKMKAPTWNQKQLQEAIQAVVTQRMRFTQAAMHYAVPKGTLYDHILGKSKRMLVLDEADLSANEERAVLEFCCETSVSPYNRRTKKSLAEVLRFLAKLRRNREGEFALTGVAGFRWWWAFCKKHSIVSLYYAGAGRSQPEKEDESWADELGRGSLRSSTHSKRVLVSEGILVHPTKRLNKQALCCVETWNWAFLSARFNVWHLKISQWFVLCKWKNNTHLRCFCLLFTYWQRNV